MKAVRLTRNLVVVIALVVSLGANVTLFVGGVLYGFVDKFVEEAFDLATAAGKQRKALAALKTSSAKQAKALARWKAVAARQRGELSTLKGTATKQRREIRRLAGRSAKQGREIAALRAAAVKQGRALNAVKTDSIRQGRELAASRTVNRTLRGQLGNVRHVAASTAKRSRDRLVKSVGRSIRTAPGKIVPYAGIAVVAGLTVWEIKDLCATIQDMDEIQRVAAESKAKAESEPAVCSVRLPSRERLLEQIEDSAEKAWESRKKFIPDLPSWEDIPDSWRGAWRGTVPDILRDTRDGLKRFLP